MGVWKWLPLLAVLGSCMTAAAEVKVQLVPSLGHPLLSRHIEIDPVNQLLITEDPSSGRIISDLTTARQILWTPPPDPPYEDDFFVPVPGKPGLFVSNTANRHVLRFGGIVPKPGDWTVPVEAPDIWRSAHAASATEVYVVGSRGVQRFNTKRRITTDVKSFSECSWVGGLAFQPGEAPSFAACSAIGGGPGDLRNGIRIVPLRGIAAPRVLSSRARRIVKMEPQDLRSGSHARTR